MEWSVSLHWRKSVANHESQSFSRECFSCLESWRKSSIYLVLREPVNRFSHDKELLKVRDSRSNQCSKDRDSVGGGQRSLTSLISQFRKKAGEPIPFLASGALPVCESVKSLFNVKKRINRWKRLTFAWQIENRAHDIHLSFLQKYLLNGGTTDSLWGPLTDIFTSCLANAGRSVFIVLTGGNHK